MTRFCTSLVAVCLLLMWLHWFVESTNTTCSSPHFNCSDGKYCIPIAQRCNHERDCLDGSDELDCVSLFLVTTNSILSILSENKQIVNHWDTQTNVSAVEWDDVTHSVYWSSDGYIYWYDLNTRVPHVLLENCEVTALAFDWIHSQMYFIDSLNNRMEVFSVVDPSIRRVLLYGLSAPVGLVVSPTRGYMVWIESQIPVIFTADMDGSNRRDLVSSKLWKPRLIKVDLVTEFIYWYDEFSSSIERVYHDGTRREVMLSVRFVLSSFDVHNGIIFYSIKGSDCVLRYDVLRHKNSTFVRTISPLSYMSVYFKRGSYTEWYISPCLYYNCSHLCVVTNNNKAVCLCSNGYELVNSTQCEKISSTFGTLLHNNSILYTYLSGSHLSVLHTIHSNAPLCSALDPSDDSILVYAESTVDKAVIKTVRFEADRSRVSSISVLYWELLSEVSSIVIDPQNQLIIWTDSDRGVIEVGGVEGNKRSVIVGNAFKPSLLQLDSSSNKLYWVDTGENDCSISRVDLDGANRELVVHLSDTSITSLAVATLSRNGEVVQYLLWTDTLEKISCYDIETESTYTLTDFSSSHSSVSMLDDIVYWFDAHTDTLYSATMLPGQPPYTANTTALYRTKQAITQVNFISYNQTTHVTTPCDISGICSHLCVASSTYPYYTCLCPVGIKSSYNCSLLPSRFLLLSLHGDVQYISLDTEYTLPGLLYHREGLIIGAVDAYTPTGDVPLIVWSEISSQDTWAINQLDISTNVVSVLVEGAFTRGLAVDQSTGNVFYTDRISRSVNVFNINTRTMKMLVHNNGNGSKESKPRSVAIDPTEGYIFWTDWGLGTIERSRLDGSQRRVLIYEPVYTPSGLSINRPNKRIYWVSYSAKTIETCDYNGMYRHTIITNLSQPYSITLDYPQLYFTDWKRNTLNSISLSRFDTSSSVTYKFRSIIMDVEYIDTRVSPTGPCSYNNGGCSHLCLQLGNNKHICECNNTSLDCDTPLNTTIYSVTSATTSSTHTPTDEVKHTVFMLYVLLAFLSGILLIVLTVFCVFVRLIYVSNRRSKRNVLFKQSPFLPPKKESPPLRVFSDVIFSLTRSSPSPPVPGEVYTEIQQEPVTTTPEKPHRATSTPDITSADIFYTPIKDPFRSISIQTPKRLVSRSKVSYKLLPKLNESIEEINLPPLSDLKKDPSHYHSSLF